MFNNLDATNFSSSIPFYDVNFEDILSKITICYHKMIENKEPLIKDENKIRDALVNDYLNNPTIKKELKLEYFINPEVPERNNKRPDIKFQSPNTFYNPEQYYSIECKVLKNENLTGEKGLNAKYVYNGIYRFTSNYYSSFYRVNAMIGFIVDKLNIHENTEKNINLLLQENKAINTTKEITKSSFIEDFEYHYDSEHLDKNNQKIKIYHLMFDFNKNILN
jgi:hypothetical protein